MLASPPSERELSAVKVHVADINFAQNNQESLRAHRKRGKVARKLDLSNLGGNAANFSYTCSTNSVYP